MLHVAVVSRTNMQRYAMGTHLCGNWFGLVDGWQVPFLKFKEEAECQVSKRSKGLVYAILQRRLYIERPECSVGEGPGATRCDCAMKTKKSMRRC